MPNAVGYASIFDPQFSLPIPLTYEVFNFLDSLLGGSVPLQFHDGRCFELSASYVR
jgi:hypothetical protein